MKDNIMKKIDPVYVAASGACVRIDTGILSVDADTYEYCIKGNTRTRHSLTVRRSQGDSTVFYFDMKAERDELKRLVLKCIAQHLPSYESQID